MAINFLDNIQLNQNQLLGARIGLVSSDPEANQLTGDIIYNSSTNILKYWNGTSWVSLTADTVLPTATASVLGGVKLFSDTDQSVAANTVSTTSGRTYGVQFNSSDQMVVNVPWSDTNTTEWILEGDTGNEDITASTKVKFVGGANITTVASTGDGRELLTINLDDTITLAGDLTVTGGDITLGGAGRIQGIDTVTDGTDAASKAYVDLAVEGGLNVKGGFNATTGAITTGGNLTSGGSRVAIAIGDYYVVTVAGNFFSNTATPLTVGDSVLVQTAAEAGASIEDDFAVIQSDTDLATLTNVGLGNVNNKGLSDAAMRGLSVSYASGTASVGLDIKNESLMTTTPADGDKMIIYDLVDEDNVSSNASVTLSTLKTYFGGSTGVNILLSTGSGVAKTVSGGVTTYAITVSNSAFFGTGATAINTKAEVLTSGGETVYAAITRATDVLSIAFVGTITDGDYRALLINVA